MLVSNGTFVAILLTSSIKSLSLRSQRVASFGSHRPLCFLKFINPIVLTVFFPASSYEHLLEHFPFFRGLFIHRTTVILTFLIFYSDFVFVCQ